VSSIIAENSTGDYHVDVVSNPEFLREGSAIADFMQPDRIVIGTSSREAEAEAEMRELYRSLDAPLVVTDVRTSEMIKYAANAFLVTKILFMNEIANICELVNVDVKVVGQGIGHDHRIGTQFMNPGIGYGGSCFPKDSREVPALLVIDQLLAAGATIRAHDPIAMDAVRAAYGDRIHYCTQLYEDEASHDVDALLLATEWNEYKNIDFAMVRKLMRGSTVIDGRNIFDPEKVVHAGLSYVGVGRPRRTSPAMTAVS
jgi:UDPglucose 6-dehydrogenase